MAEHLESREPLEIIHESISGETRQVMRVRAQGASGMDSEVHMKPLVLTEHEQELLAELMRALETARPGWMFEVRPELADNLAGIELLLIEVTRILEGVPQEPGVTNPVSRATINNGDIEALAKGMAPAILHGLGGE